MSSSSEDDRTAAEEAPAVDDALAQRLAELTHREVALRRITEVVEEQRTRLEERELALESRSVADERLAEAVARAERAEQRVRELEQQLGAVQTPPAAETAEPVLEEEPVWEPPPPARAPIVDLDATESTYTLQRLERLVHEARLRGDPQAEEWEVYLPLLREQAEPDGRLPAQFASLVDSIFSS
jgi:hypothetical protein